ncbi:MAG: hypothetical protein ACRDCN_10000 [Tannerellaceae bacterium]
MKKLFIFLFIGYCSINALSAQLLVDHLPVPSASQREWIQQTQRIPNRSQQNRKVIYRRICVTEQENKPLFFPSSYKDRHITFTELVVGSILLDRIPAFAYQSSFTDLSALDSIKPDSILWAHKLHIRPSDSTSSMTMQISDIDWNTIGAYLIKEVHYLSANDSRLQFEIEAICPLYVEYIDEESGYYPLAWIKFNDIEPFLMLLNTSIYNKNDNDSYSLNDYFRMHLYEGDIIRLGERFERTSYTATEDNQKGGLYTDSILKSEIGVMEHRYFTPQDSLPTRKKKTMNSSPHRSVKR